MMEEQFNTYGKSLTLLKQGQPYPKKEEPKTKKLILSCELSLNL